MPRHHSTSKLSEIIKALRDEWYTLTDRKGEIEETFKQLGIDFKYEPHRRGRRPGRPKGSSAPKAKPSHRRKRRTFSETASEFVLGLLKGKKLVTSEINQLWKKAGRGGVADNTLGKLVKTKKIKKRKIRGGRGSKYQGV